MRPNTRNTLIWFTIDSLSFMHDRDNDRVGGDQGGVQGGSGGRRFETSSSLVTETWNLVSFLTEESRL